MNNQLITLLCDDDVVLFEKDTFKISRLKELLSKDLSIKLNKLNYNQQTKSAEDYIFSSFSKASIGQDCIKVNEIQFQSVVYCQILRIGGKGWQKGNLKIQVSQQTNITIDRRRYENNFAFQPDIYLEFCPDEPEEPESPLDDIRLRLNKTLVD
ncbi:KGK domain-containing protein [Tolypothrix bouteillei VB521301_2]|uniref:KGK domain-containing protein n=1 Tax=Tolypothrix bouteillei TaxID=1246981 RepID=UPI000513EE50